MNILMISVTFPYPPGAGGTQIRTYNLIRQLSRRHHVTVVTQVASEKTQESDVEALKSLVSGNLICFPAPNTQLSHSGFAKIQRLVASITSGVPSSVRSYRLASMQDWIDHAIESRNFDAVTCEHSVNELFIRPHFKLTTNTVLDVHSSIYGWHLQQLQTGTSAHYLRDAIYLPIQKNYERRLCNKFSRIVVTTELDKRCMAEITDRPIHVVPNGVDLELFKFRSVDPGGHSLVFTGAMDSQHNIAAVLFFVKDVLPVVRRRFPDATLTIVGARPVQEVEALGNLPGVVVTGTVSSVVKYLHDATVYVAPLVSGLGIKNKTLEAMAAGIPVVGSNSALEGLERFGAALCANKVEEYVLAIEKLFQEPLMRKELAERARASIDEHYTWDRAGDSYEQALLCRNSPS